MDRALDVIIACILIASMLPLMVVVAFAIRFDSPGPVRFGSDRPDLRRSYGNRLFPLRTRDESDKTRGVAPSPSRVGQFLYLTRVGGLPQLLEMLWGALTLFSKRCVIR